MKDAILQDIWIHLAALLAIGLGAMGWYATGLTHDPSSVELMFILGGLAGLGVKIVNGSATVLAANVAAGVVAKAVATQTAATTKAASTAADVVAKAAEIAGQLPPSTP